MAKLLFLKVQCTCGKRKRHLSEAFGALALVLGTFHGAASAEFSDPDWPCIQRKVPHLSVGQMWAGPPISEAALKSWRDDPGSARLAPILAARRTSMDQVKSLIDEYANEAGKSDAKEARLAMLFAGIFSLIEHERITIISGIARYAHKQSALAARIEGMRDEILKLEAAAEPDYDKIEELQDKVDWDTRIFHDRGQSLAYVCETPVILEKRAFELARTILGHLD